MGYIPNIEKAQAIDNSRDNPFLKANKTLKFLEGSISNTTILVETITRVRTKADTDLGT